MAAFTAVPLWRCLKVTVTVATLATALFACSKPQAVSPSIDRPLGPDALLHRVDTAPSLEEPEGTSTKFTVQAYTCGKPGRQCVDWARERWSRQWGNPAFYGNAKTWYDQANNKGLFTGDKPWWRSVMVFDEPAPTGHVAVVEYIWWNYVFVSHQNWPCGSPMVGQWFELVPGGAKAYGGSKTYRLRGFIYSPHLLPPGMV